MDTRKTYKKYRRLWKAGQFDKKPVIGGDPSANSSDEAVIARRELRRAIFSGGPEGEWPCST